MRDIRKRIFVAGLAIPVAAALLAFFGGLVLTSPGAQANHGLSVGLDDRGAGHHQALGDIVGVRLSEVLGLGSVAAAAAGGSTVVMRMIVVPAVVVSIVGVVVVCSHRGWCPFSGLISLG